MPVDVVMPKLGMTMQEGTLVEWLKADGATVIVGEPIFVLSTDKLEAEIEAEASGTLRHVAEPGDTMPTGGVLGMIVAAEDQDASLLAAAPFLPSDGATAPSGKPAGSPGGGAPERGTGGLHRLSPNARRLSRELGVEPECLVGTGAGGRVLGRDVEAAASVGTAGAVTIDELRASSTARRVAATLGVDLTTVTPSSPGGEISRQDVEAAAAAVIRDHVGGEQVSPMPSPSGTAAVTRVPLVGMRGVTASRMHSSLQEMAQLTIGMEARADRLTKLREELKVSWPRDGRSVPTYTDMVALAVARALGRHPRLNATVGVDAIEVIGSVHIGIAVAIDGGLVVPVVRDADKLTLTELAERSAHLVELAHAGRLSIDDMSGGTFSVTSLGGYGVDFFTPVINPPNVAILGIGRIRNSVRFTSKTRRPRPTTSMTLSLTFDHRAVDGAPAAEFLGAVRDFVEAPSGLLR